MAQDGSGLVENGSEGLGAGGLAGVENKGFCVCETIQRYNKKQAAQGGDRVRVHGLSRSNLGFPLRLPPWLLLIGSSSAHCLALTSIEGKRT